MPLDIRSLQAPLREGFKRDPSSANIELIVASSRSDLADPLHCAIAPESVDDVVWRSGAHAAVGGAGDVPSSADLLLGALAACQETTLRMVAANLGIELEALEVRVTGDWDPRGTLAMGKEFPIGLKAIHCATSISVKGDVQGERAERFLKSAERYCVVLNTLRNGVPVDSTFNIGAA